MKQTLIKLVDAILKQMEEQPELMQSESGIRTWLTQKGFNKRDIEDVLKLVRPRFAHRPPAPASHGRLAVRALSYYEAYKLSPEARDALVRLELSGLIDAYEREMILERLNHIEGEAGMDELDYILSWVVAGTRDYETQKTLYNVFEGQGDTFH